MFLSPDEGAHLARSLQISEGDLIGKSIAMDPAVDIVWNSYAPLIYNAKARLSAKTDREAKSVGWSGAVTYQQYPNVRTYPPTGYVPQALGILLGKAAGLGIVRTFQLARLLNGLAAIAVGALALQFCRRGRMVIFTLLLFPASLSLFASGSQDASLIAFAALAFAIVSRLTFDDASKRSLWLLAALAVLLLLLCLARPAYAPLMLVLLLPGVVPDAPKGPRWSIRVALLALLMTVVVLWVALFALTSQAEVGLSAHSNVSPSAQSIYLLQHPRVIPSLILATLNPNSLSATWVCAVGCLGYGGVWFSHGYYVCATAIIALAASADILADRSWKFAASAVMGFAAIASVAAVYLAIYLIWMPVGSPAVISIHGRYFIPIMTAAAIALPGLCRLNPFVRLLRVAVMAFPFATLLFLPEVVIQGFYLG